MFKQAQKASDDEIHKQASLAEFTETLELNIFKLYLRGYTITKICHQYNLSPGQVQIKIKEIMYLLPNKIRIPMPKNEIFQEPLKHIHAWLAIIETFESMYKVVKYNEIFNSFLKYFKDQDKLKRESMLKILQQNHE